MEDEIILEMPVPSPADAVTPPNAPASAGDVPQGEVAAVELPPEKQYCIFRAGSERYCLSVLDIEEVVEWTKVTAVPLAPAFMVGIFNLRGTIVPVIDVAANQVRRFDTAQRRVVVGFLPVAESHGYIRIGIAADEVIGTCSTVEPLMVEEIPDEMPHCCGLLKIGNNLAMALDLKRLAEVFPVPVI